MSFKVPLHKVDDEVARHVALAETREALDDPGNLRKRLEQLPVTIRANADLRLKYPNDPERFLESEEMLDQLLVDLHALAAQPELLDSRLVEVLIGLLEHENSDIVGRTITLVRDCTEMDEATNVADYEAMLNWATAFCDAGGLSRLLGVMGVLEEEFMVASLELLENLLELDENLLLRHVTVWIPWLFERATRSDLFAAELLVTLVQADPTLLEADVKVFDALLAVLAPFLEKDPEPLEVEWLENVIDLTCLLLLKAEGKAAFCECDGFKLVYLMLSRLNWLRCRATKLLDYALSNAGMNVAEASLQAGILGCLGPMLMERGWPKLQKRYSFNGADEMNRIISIMASLWKHFEERMQEKFYSETDKREKLLSLRDRLNCLDDEDSQYALLQLDTILIHFPEVKESAIQRIRENLAEYEAGEQERLQRFLS